MTRVHADGPVRGLHLSVDWVSLSNDLSFTGTNGLFSSPIDFSDQELRLSVGCRFNRHFGLELSHGGLGSGEWLAIVDEGHRIEADGLAFHAVGYLPLRRWTPFARVGALDWSAEGEYTGFLSVPIDASGTDLTWGIGVELDLKKGFALQAAHDEHSLGSKSDSSATSVGIKYQF